MEQFETHDQKGHERQLITKSLLEMRRQVRTQGKDGILMDKEGKEVNIKDVEMELRRADKDHFPVEEGAVEENKENFSNLLSLIVNEFDLKEMEEADLNDEYWKTEKWQSKTDLFWLRREQLAQFLKVLDKKVAGTPFSNKIDAAKDLRNSLEFLALKSGEYNRGTLATMERKIATLEKDENLERKEEKAKEIKRMLLDIQNGIRNASFLDVIVRNYIQRVDRMMLDKEEVDKISSYRGEIGEIETKIGRIAKKYAPSFDDRGYLEGDTELSQRLHDYEELQEELQHLAVLYRELSKLQNDDAPELSKVIDLRKNYGKLYAFLLRTTIVEDDVTTVGD